MGSTPPVRWAASQSAVANSFAVRFATSGVCAHGGEAAPSTARRAFKLAMVEA
jgi:hypothetical protein